MTVIEKIKAGLDRHRPLSAFGKDMALLVEFYEAAEDYIRERNLQTADKQRWPKICERFQAARAKLEAQDG